MWDLIRFSSSPAITGEDGTVITYDNLVTESKKIYEKVGRRCLVFSLCRNEIGSVLGYVSFIENRVVPLLLAASIDKELLSHLLEVYKPSFLWVPDDISESVIQSIRDVSETSSQNTSETNSRNVSDTGIRGTSEAASDVVVLNDPAVIYNSYGYSLIKTGFDKEYELFEELCLLLTTSGSTGSPKLVRQSYKNVLANATSIAEYLKLTSDEKPITTLPMNYTYGLSIINSHLLVGANILVTEKGLMQKDFWTFFKEAGATSFGGVPYTYEMLEKLRFFRMDLPSLRYMTQAGGKLTVELHKKCAEYAAEKGKKFIVMYGQCEATARMGYLPADQALAKIGSMGIAIPGGTFYLYDEKDKTITEPDVTGELIYEGENVTLGYAEKGEGLSLGDERHGVLHTGDMAKRDADGFYYIVGRKKRFLKIYGNRVNLDEVERLIKGHFGVSDAACGGVDDHMFLFVTDESIAEEVKKFVAAKTGLNPVAFKTVVIDEIPKNDSGKTLYRGLEKYYGIAD